MLPLNRLSEALQGYQQMMFNHFEELINATDLVISKPNILQKEDNGLYSMQAIGTLDEMISTLTKQLKHLQDIKSKIKEEKSE